MTLPFPLLENVCLRRYNSFGLNANARYLFELNNAQDLPQLFTWINQQQLPWITIGSGSNLLLLENFKGVVIVNQLQGIEVEEQAQHFNISVAAGEDWHEFVKWTIEHGYFGLENLALIPGTLGASPVQNIGAYGLELADVCSEVEFFHLETQSLKRLNSEQCEFNYRDSIFKQSLKGKVVITNITLCLAKQWSAKLSYSGLNQLPVTASAKQVFDKVCELRNSKLPDPSKLGNAGSFFKNPIISRLRLEELLTRFPALPHYSTTTSDVKVAAGWLIDQLGLKGHRIGDAAVHQEQALVLVNIQQASANNVLDLCRHIRQQVWQQFSILLEPEVRFIGELGEVQPNSVLGLPNARE
ncbi:UDP-N-acetylenolpyruvoylglucosamine reductase [Agarivorans sp. Toyoura001]|uniref:UDP-N-acetylmuramate dehydrogenase n=1 Tax=Agarivorans sp. Toyoura001 TaxID=2283141 RepID=UPI0010E5526D|nr:UDP-N-acetylmuramate dehydrogenase [Agarivorans sp. Toyoura001]GDY27232.1 UDP-N-acetylenolpyruvoylglucosamine reductase [Agarivorans sp. Toyoura001]